MVCFVDVVSDKELDLGFLMLDQVKFIEYFKEYEEGKCSPDHVTLNLKHGAFLKHRVLLLMMLKILSCCDSRFKLYIIFFL